MYQNFFGLKELPFELTANAKYLFMTPAHREALSNLQYGLVSHKPITVLIGEAGTGKTTLLRRALESEACRRMTCVYVNNPALTRDEFVETLARGFSLSPLARESKATMLVELESLLRTRRAAGESLALVVDEAQRLSDELLEEIRLLANIETPEAKLLPLIVAGQPELADRLRATELRQFRQRVALRCEIEPFTLSDTAGYIAHRIRVAGGQAVHVFTREAVALIHDRSGGIPRTINVVCDNALIGGFARGVRRISSEIVAEVCRDFDISAIPDESPDERGTAPALAPAQQSQLLKEVAVGPASVVTAPAEERSDAAAEPVATPTLFTDAVRRRRFSLFG